MTHSYFEALGRRSYRDGQLRSEPPDWLTDLQLQEWRRGHDAASDEHHGQRVAQDLWAMGERAVKAQKKGWDG